MRPALHQQPSSPQHGAPRASGRSVVRMLTAAAALVVGQGSFCPAALHPVSDACDVMLDCYYRDGANFPDSATFGALLNPDARRVVLTAFEAGGTCWTGTDLEAASCDTRCVILLHDAATHPDDYTSDATQCAPGEPRGAVARACAERREREPADDVVPLPREICAGFADGTGATG